MPWKRFRLSRLMLGTVQFGMPNYGVANKTGQPSYQAVRDMLAFAFQEGVNCLDTAADYGESEERIGKALEELHLADKIMVVTKVALADATPLERAADLIRQSVARSLKRLRLDCLPVCLCHNENVYRHIEVLFALQDEGLVRHIGVSAAFNPELVADLLKSGRVAAVQFPSNVLDQRYRHSGLFSECRRRDTAVFIRSVYLQGLLLMPEADILPELAAVIAPRRVLEHLAQNAGMGMAELAIRYMLSLEGVTSVVIGLETIRQLQENVQWVVRGPLEPALQRAIEAAVPDLPELVLTPPLWPKK
jgi:aryl-alcohol dehydrogenase-like predicted oxidoreductase